MVCPSRGAFSRYAQQALFFIADPLSLVFQKIQGTICGHKPKAIIPALVVDLAAETGGYMLLSLGLEKTNQVAEEVFPFYKSLPLIGYSVASIVFLRVEHRVSRVARSAMTLMLPAFMAYAQISSEGIVSGAADAAALILGGYMGLRLVGSNLSVQEYSVAMSRYWTVGRCFEAIIVPAGGPCFALARTLTSSVIKSIAYNPQPLVSAMKLVQIQRYDGTSFITSALAQLLMNRFGSIDSKAIANTISSKFFPAFSSSFVARNFIEPQLSHRIKALEGESSHFAALLIRALIQYRQLIDSGDINMATSELLTLFLNHEPKTKIDLAKESLLGLIDVVVSGKASYQSRFLHSVEEKSGLSKELAELVCQFIEQIPINLIGIPLYTRPHLKFVKAICNIHLKHYINLVVNRLLDCSIGSESLDKTDELALIEIVQKVIYVTLISPILPESMVKALAQAKADLKSAVKDNHFKVYPAPFNLAIKDDHFA